jgi:2-alkyl-3-oxoalkanoate reductase
MSMKIVVTGATGFVGATLVRRLAQAGHTVLATGRQSSPPPNLLQYAEYRQADITRPQPLFKADACIHAAALASDTASYDRLYAANVEGSRQVVQAARNCAHFIQISSSSVYRFHMEAVREQEAFPCPQLSPYGLSKLLAEKVVMSERESYGHTLILRPRAIYGVGDRVLLPRLLKLLVGKTILCPVEKDTRTSLTHVDNLVYAVMLFLEQKPCPSHQTFNVADEPVYLLREVIIDLLKGITSSALTVRHVPSKGLRLLVQLNEYLRIGTSFTRFSLESLTQSAVLDTSSVRSGLGYRPRHNFLDALPLLTEWIQWQGGVQSYLTQQEQAPWLPFDQKYDPIH